MTHPHYVVIGGGAAGFFGAIRCAELAPDARVTILEATRHPLAKVRVSGGGRCNVTHACFDPRELVRNYPRGARELLGLMHRFGPADTVAWFEARGVKLKTEADGRMFPITDSSATIVDALLHAARNSGVRLRTGAAARSIERADATGAGGSFCVHLANGETLRADAVLLATGGNRGAAGVAMAEALGHTIEPQVPSLFTFHIDDPRLHGLAGLAVARTEVSVPEKKLRAEGPTLVTHWGLSGPAILRLSAHGAHELHQLDYRFPIRVSWAPGKTEAVIAAVLAEARQTHRRQRVTKSNPFAIPARLWIRLVSAAGLGPECAWSTVSNSLINALAQQVAGSEFRVSGKSMNKEEFVTCGGVRLREIDFKTMQSRIAPGVFFAGELLDIDGLTGGFNFQAAWTTGWLAGTAMAAAE